MIWLLIFPLLTGLLIILSWFNHWVSILTVVPDGPPMVFNTALCLVLLAFSGLSLKSSNSKVAFLRKSWMLVFVISGLTILQYLLHQNYGLDELFVQSYVETLLYSPGRMALSTAICLLISSLSFAILGSQLRTQTVFGLFCFASFGIVFILASLATLSYLFNFAMTSFDAYARMALLTAMCFTVIAVVGLRLSALALFAQRRRRFFNYALKIGLCVFLLGSFFWQILLQRSAEHIRENLKAETEIRRASLEASMNAHLKSMQALQVPGSAAQIQNLNWGPGLDSLRAIVRLSRSPQMLWLSGQPATERELLLLQQQTADLRKKTSDEQSFFANLNFQRDRWMGFIDKEILFLYSPINLLTQAFPVDQYQYFLISEGQLIFSSGSGIVTHFSDWKLTLPLQIENSQLKLEIIPTEKTLNNLKRVHPAIYLVGGLLFSLVLLTLIFFLPSWEDK